MKVLALLLVVVAAAEAHYFFRVHYHRGRSRTGVQQPKAADAGTVQDAKTKYYAMRKQLHGMRYALWRCYRTSLAGVRSHKERHAIRDEARKAWKPLKDAFHCVYRTAYRTQDLGKALECVSKAGEAMPKTTDGFGKCFGKNTGVGETYKQTPGPDFTFPPRPTGPPPTIAMDQPAMDEPVAMDEPDVAETPAPSAAPPAPTAAAAAPKTKKPKKKAGACSSSKQAQMQWGVPAC